MSFKVNDKVVCVIPPVFQLPPGVSLSMYEFVGPIPVNGSVYVVEKVFEFPSLNLIGLALVGSTAFTKANSGWDNPERDEVGYSSTFFRKLEDIQAENREKEEAAAMLKEALELINLY